MRRTLSGFLGLALSTLGLAGCGTFSIPRVAAQGTTIVFPVPAGFGAGFGRALNESLEYGVNPAGCAISPDQNSPLEDFQRGELLFALRTDSDVGSNLNTYLKVRYITRVHADEASRVALPPEGDAFYNIGTPLESGQTVAFVDIPYDVEPNTYYVFMERWKRDPQQANCFVKQAPIMFGTKPWLAWAGLTGWGGQSPEAGMQIHVVASSYGSALFHDTAFGFDKWNVDGSYSFNGYTGALDYVIPSPALRLWVGDPSTGQYPAAREFTLAYPAGKLEITGATLGGLHRSGGFVSVSTTSSPSGCDGSGTARISVIDPDKQAHWVDVVYRLRDFAQCGQAVLDDFTVVEGSQKAYNLDGNPINAVVYLDPVYSF